MPPSIVRGAGQFRRNNDHHHRHHHKRQCYRRRRHSDTVPTKGTEKPSTGWKSGNRGGCGYWSPFHIAWGWLRARGDPHNQLSVAITPPWATAQRHRRTKRERQDPPAGRHAETESSRIRTRESSGPRRYARAREKEERKRGWKETKKSSAKKDEKSDRLLPGRAQARGFLVYIRPAPTSMLLRG